MGRPGRLHHLFLGGFRLSHADIVPDGAAAQPGLLEHHAVAGAQAPSGDVPDVRAVHPDLPAVHVIEAHQQVDDGGLPGSGGAYDGHHLPCPRLQVQVMDDGAALVIAEVHMLQGHIALHPCKLRGAASVRQLLFLVQQAEHPLRRRQSRVQLIGDIGDLVDGA